MSASTERRKANEKAFRKLRRTQSESKGIKPARSKNYRDWINTLPCVVCFRSARRKQAAIRGAKPARDADYRAYIGILPCVVCFMDACPHLEAYAGYAHFEQHRNGDFGSVSECCHVGKTGKGMRQKCSDYETIPMCREHHKEQHAPDGATFFERHPIPLAGAFAALRKAYEEQK